MWLNRLVHFSSGFCFARSPIRCINVSASCSPGVEDAFRATDFPLASVLPSIDSTGVTPVFADFSGTTTSSDFSTLAPDCGFPSWAGLPDTMTGRTPSRSPDSRAGACCVRAELFDPGDWRRSTSTLIGPRPWPSAGFDGVGSPEDICFEALSPGPLTRPPTLCVVGRPTTPKARLPGGGLLPG